MVANVARLGDNATPSAKKSAPDLTVDGAQGEETDNAQRETDDMTAQQTVQQHPASVDAYIRHRWSLVPIPPGTKGPRTVGWNIKENAIKSHQELPQGWGIGLAHAYSGTMALDIDDWTTASFELGMQGVDLQALYDAPDAVIVDSGRQGHGKLLYAMLEPLPSRRVAHDGAMVYELRCASATGLTVQDVLPPSIHPATQQPYRWAGRGHWTRLPEVPPEILAIWRGMIERDAVRSVPTGDVRAASWDEIQDALQSISADCSRADWVIVGMALHWAGVASGDVDQAQYLWDQWSAQSVKYPGPQVMAQQWRSFRTDKTSSIRIGSLFHLACAAGWNRPAPDARELFSAIISPPNLIDCDMHPPAPRVDLACWPPVLARRATEVGVSIGGDPMVPLWAGMGAICGAVDARMRLELTEGYKVPPVLWLMTIGQPADKKTPGSQPMMEILKQLELEDIPRFKRELLDWEGVEAMAASSLKAYKAFHETPEAMLNRSAAPGVVDLPPQPVPLRITVSDITSQKLVRHAADRPRGLLCYLDEMTSWINKVCDSRGGEDRSAWVEAFSAARYTLDRVGTGHTHAENYAVSIYGNVQPRVLIDNIKALSADGLLQRFLPIVLDGERTTRGEPIPLADTNTAAWEQTVRMVYALPAQTYKLSPAAHEAFREFQLWYESLRKDTRIAKPGIRYETALGKVEGLLGRITLLWHVIEAPFAPEVSVDLMRRAITMVQDYAIPALRYTLVTLADDGSFDGWVRDHIIHYCDTGTILMREIKNSARRQLVGVSSWAADQMILGAMATLEKATWVLRMDDGSRESQHHAEWAINPALAERFKADREQVIEAKQRERDFIYRLSTKPRKIFHGAQ